MLCRAENLHRRNLKPSEITRSIVRLYEALHADDEGDRQVERGDKRGVERSDGAAYKATRGSIQVIAGMVGYKPSYLQHLWARRRLVDDLIKLADRHGPRGGAGGAIVSSRTRSATGREARRASSASAIVPSRGGRPQAGTYEWHGGVPRVRRVRWGGRDAPRYNKC